MLASVSANRVNVAGKKPTAPAAAVSAVFSGWALRADYGKANGAQSGAGGFYWLIERMHPKCFLLGNPRANVRI